MHGSVSAIRCLDNAEPIRKTCVVALETTHTFGNVTRELKTQIILEFLSVTQPQFSTTVNPAVERQTLRFNDS